MARFSEYLDYKDVLPGDVVSSGLNEYFPQDTLIKNSIYCIKKI
jgi:hypothetical protein